MASLHSARFLQFLHFPRMPCRKFPTSTCLAGTSAVLAACPTKTGPRLQHSMHASRQHTQPRDVADKAVALNVPQYSLNTPTHMRWRSLKGTCLLVGGGVLAARFHGAGGHRQPQPPEQHFAHVLWGGHIKWAAGRALDQRIQLRHPPFQRSLQWYLIIIHFHMCSSPSSLSMSNSTIMAPPPFLMVLHAAFMLQG